MSVTSIIGPLLMTQLFGAFTGSSNPYHFPGAPMVMGGAYVMKSVVSYARFSRVWCSEA
ncbi:MAG: hypothetical protein U5K54_20770 [Cytophagales bacterium]|nr:hypothetical protein [Cytophagales bacterium]